MRLSYLILTLLSLLVFSPAHADCIKNQYGEVMCGGGQCIKDAYGNVFCASVDGGAMRDDHGNVKCGTGYCAKDRDGEIWCSTVPGGDADTDAYGKVKCYKGCEEAKAERCEPGQ